MSLVIENGSLVANAVTYASVDDLRAFAAARKSTLPSDDDSLEAALIVAMDFIEGFRTDFKGLKVDPLNQPLQWPRTGVLIDGAKFPATSIPKELIAAQCQLAIECAAGVDLMPTGDGRGIVREKIDIIETEYAPNNGGAPQPIFVKAKAFLDPLLNSGGTGRLNVTRG